MAFWKRDDPFDLPLDGSDPSGPSPAAALADPFAPPAQLPHPWEQPPQPEQPSLAPAYSPTAKSGDHDLELINSKLDTIKAMLTSLEQRIGNLERASGTGQEKRLW